MLEDGVSTAVIQQLTGVSAGIISDIRCGHSWKNISNQYNIPISKQLYSDDAIKHACELLQDPRLSMGYIAEQTGMSIDSVKGLASGESYLYISSRYNIPPRDTSGSYGNRGVYSEEQIRNACDLLSKNTPAIDITKQTGVKPTTVYDLLHKKKWKFITDEYDFSGYQLIRYPK